MSTIVKSSTQTLAKTEGFNEEQVALIKRVIAPQATDDELSLFLHHAKRAGLDPLAKQIYFQKFGGRATFVVSIDGYRLIAGRTGHYAGSDDAIFDSEEKPAKATVTIYKLVGGVRCPFTATARWSEYCPPSPRDMMWKKMPTTMLAKCAEGLALRKAFPAELSGIYTKEEMDQAGGETEAPVNKITVINESTGEVTAEIPERLQKILRSFEELGLDQIVLETYLKKPISEWQDKEIELLRAYYYQQKPNQKS